LKIAVIGPRVLHGHYGGIERLCEYLCSCLAARGHDITMFVGNRELGYGPKSGNFRYVPVWTHDSSALETVTKSFSSTFRILFSESFDVVHIHGEPACLVLPLLSLRKVPVVVTVHGLDWSRRRWQGLGRLVIKLAERCMIRFAHDIIVVSKDLEPYFAKRGRPASVVVSGVPPAVVQPIVPRRDRARPYVIVFSRLVAEKRIGDAISAIRSFGSECDLLIAGSGPDLQRLRTRARGYPHVYFLGHMQPPELWSFVAGAAVSLATSELEGMPLAVLEALALAVPVIASDIPPHREILGPQYSRDLLFPVGNVARLQERLRTVLDRPQHFARIGTDLRERVLTKFSHISTVEETEKVLVRVVRRSNRVLPVPEPLASD
jgi:glycosyltransferase involved in cell wall biosynthesis